LLVAMDSAKRTAGEVMPCNGNDLLEAKDGTFEPLGEDEVMETRNDAWVGQMGL